MLIRIPDDAEAAASARAAIVADGRLTFGALGLLLVILDHAPEWRVNFDSLSRWARDRRDDRCEGRDTVRLLLAELESHGYLVCARPVSDVGRLVYDVEVFAVPQGTRAPSDKPQVVYVIGQSGARVAKIGTTSNLPARLRVIQTGSPVRLEVLWICPGGRRLESWLHDAFRSLRLEGEWFDFRQWDPALSVKRTVEQARMMGVE